MIQGVASGYAKEKLPSFKLGASPQSARLEDLDRPVRAASPPAMSALFPGCDQRNPKVHGGGARNSAAGAIVESVRSIYREIDTLSC